MEELKLNSGLKKIAIKDEDGDLITVLRVNVADADTAERFAKIINNLQEISENCEKEAAAWKRNTSRTKRFLERLMWRGVADQSYPREIPETDRRGN